MKFIYVVRNNIIAGIFLLCGAIGYFIYSTSYTFGTIDKPGSGFLPVILSMLLFVLASMLILSSIRRKKILASKPSNPNEMERNSDVSQNKMAFKIFAFLTFYIISFEYIGFIISTLLMLISMFKIMGIRSWRKIAITSVAITICAYGLFVACLKVSLPQGELITWLIGG